MTKIIVFYCAMNHEIIKQIITNVKIDKLKCKKFIVKYYSSDMISLISHTRNMYLYPSIWWDIRYFICFYLLKYI